MAAKINKTTTKGGEERYHKRVVIGYRANGDPIQRMVSGKTRREVDAAARALQVDLARGVTADPGKIRLGAFVMEWLARKEKHVRSSTVAGYRYIVDKHIMPDLGGTLLRELNTRMLQNWVDKFTAPDTAIRCRRILHTILEEAGQQGLLQNNPSSRVTTPPRPASRATSWSKEEARAFLKVAAQHPYHPYWHLAVRLALRPSELVGLKWHAVDLDAGRLRVQEGRATVGASTFDGGTKSPSGYRTLDLPSDVIDVLRRHKVKQATRRLALGPRWEDHDLVCTAREGQYILNANINTALKRLVEDAGVKRIRPYDLRHTAISLMAEAGADMKAISEVAGHANVRITRDVYQHINRNQRAAALQALGDALEGREEPPAAATKEG